MNQSNYINPEAFKSMQKGKETGMVVLKNANNLEAGITNYGARWIYMLVKDKNQRTQDVIMGFDNLDGYLQSTETFYGPCIGRVANRISKGKFCLEGNTYALPINNAPNHLHGGPEGFHNQVWDMKQLADNKVELSYFSRDMEGGYPGNLEVSVVYTLSENNCMEIEYTATTDATTIVNLTNHAYFNLNGFNSGSILDHRLWINADGYTPMDEYSIPFGSIEPVAGTAFDFRIEKAIGRDIEQDNLQLKHGSGYDHNFVLNQGYPLVHAAKVIGNLSGIQMDVYTTEPGMQLYTGNFMNAENTMKKGFKDGYRNAFCLETQHFPDTINQPAFPSYILNPGQVYKTQTKYCFSN